MRPLREWSLDHLRQRQSLKWSLFGPDVLPLWVAEMDAPLALAVTEALHRVVDQQDLGYPTGEGYAEAFGDFAQDTWGWRPDVALASHDVMAAVLQALRIVTEPGDAIIVNPPVYPPFHDAVVMAGGQPVHVPLGSSWRLELDALAEAFATHAGHGAYLLCNPQNPTSIAPTRDELVVIAELAERHGIRVVADEIHAPLTPVDDFTPYLSVPGTDNAYVATSASKAWNLAGIKAGLLLGGPGTESELAALPGLAQHGASTVGIWTQIAALRDGRDWLHAVQADLIDNRALVRQLVADHLPMAHAVIGSASYLAWLDLRDYDLGADPATVLRERAGVALGEGPPFGSGEGFARLNYATTPEVLQLAFERLRTALHGH